MMVIRSQSPSIRAAIETNLPSYRSGCCRTSQVVVLTFGLFGEQPMQFKNPNSEIAIIENLFKCVFMDIPQLGRVCYTMLPY